MEHLGLQDATGNFGTSTNTNITNNKVEEG
jgi:hypothetical protein